MAKSLLVTGLSGLIGQRFQHLYPDYQFENIDLTTGIDITDQDQVSAAIKKSTADTIIHLAAFTNVTAAHDQNNDTEGLCYRINVNGTKNVLTAALDQKKFLIHVSTDFVFSGTKDTPYTEADTPDPIEWYGTTKHLAEILVTEATDQALILRLSYPYQANPFRPDFLASLIDKLTTDTLPPAFTDHIITPTFTDDLCRVFDYAVTNHPTGIYHAVGSSWHTDYEIAELVKKIFNLKGSIKEGSLADYLKQTSRPYQQTLKTSNQKLQNDLNLTLSSLEQGLTTIKNNSTTL